MAAALEGCDAMLEKTNKRTDGIFFSSSFSSGKSSAVATKEIFGCER